MRVRLKHVSPILGLAGLCVLLNACSAQRGTSDPHLSRYLAYLAESQIDASPDKVAERRTKAGEMRFFQIKNAVGAHAHRAGTTPEHVAAMDSWEGWRVLFAESTDSKALQLTVGWLLGDYSSFPPVPPSVAEKAEGFVEPPMLERTDIGGFRFVAWYSGHPGLSVTRVTVTVPPNGDGDIDFTSLDEIRIPDPVERRIAQWGEVSGVGRLILVRELGELGDERAVPVLLEALTESYAETRQRAAEALGRIGSDRAIEPLVAVLNEDGEEAVRVAAAQALGELGGERAQAALQRAAAHDASQMVRSAARAGIPNQPTTE